MTHWPEDIRYTLRRLTKMPTLAAAAMLSIAIGIGANATIFAMVSRFVLRPAPVGQPPTLLALHTTQHGECCNHFTWPLFQDLQEQARSFSGVAAYYEMIPASVGGSGDPERVWGQSATANYFDVLQLPMTLGRGFNRAEARSPVVVLGYNLWRRRFAADPAIAGKAVTLSGHPFTVIGVAQPAFHGLDGILYTEFWVPLALTDQFVPQTTNFQSRNYNWLAVAARLRPGVSRANAGAELDLFGHRSAQAHPQEEKDRGFRFEQAGQLGPRERPMVSLFLAALGIVALLVLSIACANVANLLLAQASAREREHATRRALGATASRLMRLVLTESILLATGGGLLGIACSVWATRALSSLSLPAPVPLSVAVHVDWRTTLFTFALSIGAGALFGLAPALAAVRPAMASALKGEDPLFRAGSRWSIRNVLVVGQIAMSIVLLCATGLFLRSLRNATAIDLGFRPQGVLTMSVDPRLHGYTAERTAQLLHDLQTRLNAIGGVRAAAVTDVVPLSGGNRSDSFTVDGHPGSPADQSVELYMATPGYFDVLCITRIAGRDFDDEPANGPKVALVNQAFAQHYFGNGSALGQYVNGAGVRYQIIGVVGNIRSRTLGEDTRPVLFRSLAQSIATDPSLMGYSLILRAESDPAPIMNDVRTEIRKLDPTLAIYNAETMDAHVRSALFLPRLAGTLFGVFGGAGLFLAAVGLYGVMSYSVSRRTLEIGIRVALGSPVGAVQRLVLRQGMLLTLLGIVPGLGGAWAVAKFTASILYGVRPHDPLTFLLVPIVLCGIAFIASLLPARRAERVDPLTALRHD